MKRIFFMTAIIIFSFVLVACQSNDNSNADSDGTKEIQIGHDSSTDHPVQIALEEFKSAVEEKSDGSIEVKIFPNGQLGSVDDMLEQTRRGDLDMGFGASTLFTSLSEFQVLNNFYLFEDNAHAYRVLDGEGGQELLDTLESSGLEGIGFMEIGFRNFSNDKRPIETMEDVKGLKIRGYNPVQIKAWESLGVSLSSLDWAEVFTSLQQGLIDGQESATISFYDESFYEAQEYWSLTNHVYTDYLWYANQDLMSSLSEEERDIVTEEAQNAIDMQRDLMEELEEETLEQLEQEGVLINEVSQDERDKMGEIMNEAVKEDILSETGEEIYDNFMEHVEEERDN